MAESYNNSSLIPICLRYFVSLFISALISSHALLAESIKSDQPIKIGALLCLSGECAEWGENSRRGIELAISEINSEGGIFGRKLQLVVEDTDEDSGGAQAVTAFKKLRQDRDIALFIGPTWSTGGLSVAPIAARDSEIVMISPSLGVAGFNEHGTNLFNVWPHDEFSSMELARYVFKQGWRKAAIFSSQQPWESTQGSTFEAEFIRLGGSISAKEEPVPSATDIRAEAFRIVKSKPEVIYLSNTNQMGTAAQQLRRLGYKGPLMAILVDKTRIDTAAGALEGAVFARYPDPASDFVKRYTAKFGEMPGITSDTAYDSVQLYAEVLGKVGKIDREVISSGLLATKYNGASGVIAFDPKGGVRKEPVLYVVRGDQTEPLD